MAQDFKTMQDSLNANPIQKKIDVKTIEEAIQSMICPFSPVRVIAKKPVVSIKAANGYENYAEQFSLKYLTIAGWEGDFVKKLSDKDKEKMQSGIKEIALIRSRAVRNKIFEDSAIKEYAKSKNRTPINVPFTDVEHPYGYNKNYVNEWYSYERERNVLLLAMALASQTKENANLNCEDRKILTDFINGLNQNEIDIAFKDLKNIIQQFNHVSQFPILDPNLFHIYSLENIFSENGDFAIHRETLLYFSQMFHIEATPLPRNALIAGKIMQLQDEKKVSEENELLRLRAELLKTQACMKHLEQQLDQLKAKDATVQQGPLLLSQTGSNQQVNLKQDAKLAAKDATEVENVQKISADLV